MFSFGFSLDNNGKLWRWIGKIKEDEEEQKNDKDHDANPELLD